MTTVSNRLAGAVPAKLIPKKAKLSALSKVPSASGLLPLWTKNRPKSAAPPPNVPAILIAPDPFASMELESADDSNDSEEQQALTHTKPVPRHIGKKIPTTNLEESDSEPEAVELPKVSNRYSESSIQLLILVVFQSLAHISFNSKQTDSKGKARSGSTKPKAIKFDNSHLPSGILKRWREVFLPMWRDYIGRNSDPWLCERNGVIDAQRLYDKVFEPSHNAPQMLAAEKEPIFSVVWFTVSPSQTELNFSL